MSMTFRHRRTRLHRSFGAVCMAAGLCSSAAGAADLVEPAVFASSNGVLDVLMIAKPSPIPSLAFTPPDGSAAVNPTGWIYEVCKRRGGATSCPEGSGTVSDYGGVRFALSQGDVLKVHLVNKLPLITKEKLKHENDPGQANLYLNPTNLHTHGLLTPARAATLRDPTFGDYSYVSIFNSANGIPVPQATHQHGPIVMDSVDYKIPIPWNHPTGLFWFHPHIHGLSLNQVTEGMAGIITIGKAGDNIRGDASRNPWPEASVRHLTLKDTMVLAGGTIGFDSGDQPVVNGEILNQQDPNFCTQFPESATEDRRGGCPGADNSQDADDPGNNYTGGRWFYTVNGQLFPTIPITDPDGEVWRLTNASASLSYDLKLVDDTTQKPMVMQLVAVDGVSIHLPQDTTMDSVVTLAGARFKVVACPPVPGGALRSLPVCVSELVMMPSSRAEIWVTYRDQNGHVIAPPSSGATATLKQVGLTMGSGDTWPAVDLASVEFKAGGRRRLTSYALDIQGDAFNSMQPNGIFAGKVPDTDKASLQADCKPLPAGHHRRIFFGFSDVTVADTFALGYEEVDRNGAVVAGTQRPPTQFDPSQPTVCLPLGPGQTPVHETWELVQLSTENHNFHMHQARFRQVRMSAASNSVLAERPGSYSGGGIVMDNIELGVAEPTPAISDTVVNDQNGVCTVDQWHAGTCKSAAVVVDIPFSQLGEFIYHCHILEHEDGGMMAGIKVVPYSGPGPGHGGGGWGPWFHEGSWFHDRGWFRESMR